MNTEVPIQCFIIMPFDTMLRPVLNEIRSVIDELGGKRAYRADDHFQPGTIIDTVKNHIASADFCIADLSKSNPNVTWEAGYAHALGKPIIPISQQINELPANIAANITLPYELSKLNALRTK